MKRIFESFLFIFLFSFLFLQKDKILTNIKFLLSSPCDIPIEYRLGKIDKEYGLANEQFLNKIKEATQIWSRVVGKNLFIYNPQGRLAINLIYSERQSMMDRLKKLENNLKSRRESLDIAKEEYQRLVADFEKKLEVFNQEVKFWQEQGGVPEETFNRLIHEQEELKKEAEKLNKLAENLNLSVKEYNIGVSQFKKEAHLFDQTVRAKPEAGLYDGTVPKIDIYLTVNQIELLHTLAHELGHVLGLSHIDNPRGIMYPFSSEFIDPVIEEREMLKTFCQKRNFELFLEMAREKFFQKIR